MHRLNTDRLFKPYEQASVFHQLLHNCPDEKRLELMPDDYTILVGHLTNLVDELTALQMTTSALPISRAISHLTTSYVLADGKIAVDPNEWSKVENYLAQGTSRIADDFSVVALLALSPGMDRYYDHPKLFGDDVFNNFPSAANDVAESGSCLALGRNTACVMHLMRVVEAGLKALAATVGVGPQMNWGSYLRAIDKEIETRAKAAGKRTPDEQFYAESRASIDAVRLAWRNPTMHIENSYSSERAEDIFNSVRGLMRHLATKISEVP